VANLYKEYVDNLWINYQWINLELNDAQIDLNSAWIFWNAGQDHNALQRTLWALGHFMEACQSTVGHGTTPCNVNYLDKALTEAWQYGMGDFPAADVTWKSICEAWVKNDFEGKEWTIACIDRMRQLMWDKPFSIKWAADPKEEQA